MVSLLASGMQALTISPILKRLHAMNWQQQIDFMEVKEKITKMKQMGIPIGRPSLFVVLVGFNAQNCHFLHFLHS